MAADCLSGIKATFAASFILNCWLREFPFPKLLFTINSGFNQKQLTLMCFAKSGGQTVALLSEKVGFLTRFCECISKETG